MSELGIVPAVELPERLDATPAVAGGVAPYLIVTDAARALDWYRDVMGAIETTRWVGGDGRIGHAEFTIGEAHFMLADEHPEMGFLGPLSLGGTPVSLHLTVREVDRVHDAAVAAGARSERPPADQSHGNRTAVIIDPFGHRWMLSHPIEGVSSSDVTAANPTYTISGRRPVELGYITIHSSDPASTMQFFGQLFDWDIARTALGGHIGNTRFPMGVSGPSDHGVATLYFRVDDIGAYARRVEQLGGRVLVETDYQSGGNAECVDREGVRFDLWKPAPGY